MCFERRFAPCVSFAIVAFCLQTVHLILQTCVSLTIVASRFTNATFRFTIKPLLSPIECLSALDGFFLALANEFLEMLEFFVKSKDNLL